MCGQEMFERGDWIVPTFNGRLRTDKPILIYWCMIAVYHVLGVSEMAARFPSALAGLGTVVLTFHLGRLMFDSRTGTVSKLPVGICADVRCTARSDSRLAVDRLHYGKSHFVVAGVARRRGGSFNGLRNSALQPKPMQSTDCPC